jgi:squalene-associated FAD-dependent desaturase
VLVVEEAPRLGGRATSFLDKESGERVDNGQHALFGCYSATYDFLRSIGAEQNAPLQKSLKVSMARAGRVSTLSCPSLPAPWHLVVGLMKWNAVGLNDRFRALRLGVLLRRLVANGVEKIASRVPPTQTVSEWLTANGESREICEWLWNPLAVAALNQSPDRAAAAPFVRVLAELFGRDPAASAIGLPTKPLDELYAAPTQRLVESKQGEMLTRQSARIALGAGGRLAGVRLGDHLVDSPIVISAVPWHAFWRLWETDVPPLLTSIAKNAAAMADCPIVTVNLWCDRSIDHELPSSFVGLIDSPMHWIFHKGRIFGGDVDHLSIVASGAVDLLRMENTQLTKLAIDQIKRALPAFASIGVKRSVVVREPRATFSLAPDQPPRPSARTDLAGFFLAGDWTDTGLPGTIESAVRSGYAAAAAAGA